MQSDGFYPSRKIKERGNFYWLELNLWPFVAVLLVILFVMMLGQGPTHHGVGPDLAVVSHPHTLWYANREDAIQIAITRDERVFFGNSKTNLRKTCQVKFVKRSEADRKSEST